MYNTVKYCNLRKGLNEMKKKILCIAFALMLALSGCSNKTEDVPVATVGDKAVTKSEFDFYLTSVKQQMQGTELSTEEDWQTKEIDGKKAIEVAKEQALNIALTNIAYIDIYKQMGNSIGSAEKEEIKASKDQIVQQYEQNGGYDAFLESAGVSDGFIDMLCESMYCSDKLYAEFSAGRQVTDDEVNAFLDDKAEDLATYRTAKHVLILTKDMETQEPYDEAKKAEAKAKADDIYKRALAGEDFDKLVSENSEDPGSLQQPEGYTFTDGEMVQEFQDCVDSLKANEIGFCESDFGYHIIKRLELNRGYFAENAKNAILGEAFNEYIEEKMDEYGITIEELETINESVEK